MYMYIVDVEEFGDQDEDTAGRFNQASVCLSTINCVIIAKSPFNVPTASTCNVHVIS